MSKTTHYELNTPIGSEVLSVMTGLNPNFTAIDGVMYDNETRSTQALNKANVNEQNIATALGRITTAEGDIDTLESGLETANTNISGLTSRMTTAEGGLVTANNRITENTGDITQIKSDLTNTMPIHAIKDHIQTNIQTGSDGLFTLDAFQDYIPIACYVTSPTVSAQRHVEINYNPANGIYYGKTDANLNIRVLTIYLSYVGE